MCEFRPKRITDANVVEISARSDDEAILAWAIAQLDQGCAFDPEAFVIVAMYLDANSVHAPRLHAYAYQAFGVESEWWDRLRAMARHGSPLRMLAADPALREVLARVRSGESLGGEPVDASLKDLGPFKALIERLEQAFAKTLQAPQCSCA